MKNFKNLTLIDIDFNELMRIKALQTMLKHVNTDSHQMNSSSFSLEKLRENYFPILFSGNDLNLTDDNFCNYKDFPFNRYIVPFFFGPVQFNCSCAFRFLNIFGPIVKDFVDVNSNECVLRNDFYDQLLACDIDKKISRI